jgi:hypothetical protein
MSTRRARLADALGLAALLGALLYFLRPALLLLPTIAAGGDTPCHYPTALVFRHELLPHLRFHGWYPGAYLGHPLMLYYFPLPFLLMAALEPMLGMPVAFKLGTALGVLLLPPLTYASFRLMGFAFPGPLLGAAAATVFLFLEDNPIWGGTLASTLTGEFAYSYGIALGVLFLGVCYRAYARGDGPWRPALVLALTALAHGYAVLWAGLSASYFLYRARRPARTLSWLAAVGAIGFALAAFWLLPLLADWGWTTKYDDPWISVTLRSMVPPFLLPLLALAVAGLAWTLLAARRSGGADGRLLLLWHAAVTGAALAAAGPALGVIDVRFVPFAQLAVCLAGGAFAGLMLQGRRLADVAALLLLALGLLYGGLQSKVLRAWTQWNYSGLEAKELWPAFRGLCDRLQGGVGAPRVAVEYGAEHEKLGSIRAYEILPLLSGRSTLEGVYNQASLQTHAVYFVASELGASSPNPFRNREYSGFDTDNALRHLRLFNVSEIVALSPLLTGTLEARDDVTPLFREGPYAVFRLNDHGPGYVEPMAFAPVRSSPRDWREKAYRWFTRKPLSPAHLVFSDDPRFEPAERDEYLEPPRVPLPAGVEVSARVDRESVWIRTSRPGHPLLVKISYHPRWRAEGADGPYLVSPALMMIVPRAAEVRLSYGRSAADAIGEALTLAGVVVAAVLARRPRRVDVERRAPPSAANGCGVPAPPRRWGGLIPAALVLALAAPRLVPRSWNASPSGASGLDDKAQAAFDAGRFADAAEYARHALARGGGGERRGALLVLRGESQLQAGQPHEAALAFETLLHEQPQGALAPRALAGQVRASGAAGDSAGAESARQRLLKEFPDTFWARESQAAGVVR